MPKLTLTRDEKGNLFTTPEEEIKGVGIANLFNVDTLSTVKTDTSVTHTIVFLDGSIAKLEINPTSNQYSMKYEGKDGANATSSIGDDYIVMLGKK